MSRRRLIALVLLVAVAHPMVAVAAGGSRPALADSGPIEVSRGDGWINTGITLPGSSIPRQPVAQPVGGGPSGSGSLGERPAVACTYVPYVAPGFEAPAAPPPADPNGALYAQACAGAVSVVYVPNGGGPAPAGIPGLTPQQLALQARDVLVLTRPSVHRSPDETNDYEGAPFTWANLWTWFWTNPADYRAITHTVTAGPVSATVVATPVGLLFDPGDGGDVVRCPGPGRAWSTADGNDAPSSGCGYQYRHVTDGAVTSRLQILWRVTWTGTGGTGGTLPTMQTMTDAPLRVLQVQVVNR